MAEISAQDFLVQRKDLRQTRIETGPPVPLERGHALLKIDKFGLTANNITYAVFGDAMQYWNFFPVGPQLAGWGRVPVWGFAEVLRSTHPDLHSGERIYGYLPMSTHLVVKPDRVTPASFMDASPHRQPLPAAYQLYSRCAGDPLYDDRHEGERALLHPLFFTSFLIEDFLSDNGLFGASQVVLASASSKTALGTAFQLYQNRPRNARVIGLTSGGNQAFCRQTGYFDQVVGYDALATLPRVPTVFVDMAGEGRLLGAIHQHFDDQLKYSCIVGATHWDKRETQHNLPGPAPQFFFAPTQGQKRRKEWGAEGFEKRFAGAWRAFLLSVKNWLQVRHSRGPEAARTVYQEVLAGRVPPQVGHILSL